MVAAAASNGYSGGESQIKRNGRRKEEGGKKEKKREDRNRCRCELLNYSLICNNKLRDKFKILLKSIIRVRFFLIK